MPATRFTLLTLSVLAAGAPLAAQPKDNFGDPLPEGAKARVGTARMSRAGGGAEWMGATLTPDGKFLLAPVHGGAIEKLDVTTGRAAGTIGEKDDSRTGREVLQLSADGTRGMSLGDSVVSVWDAKTGKVLTRALTRVDWSLPGALATAALSGDGATLAFGVNDKPEEGKKLTVVVWSVADNKRRFDVEVEQDRYVSVALSHDGKTLATWGQLFAGGELMVPRDTPVQFWDATKGKKLGAFSVKGAWVTSVAFTPDGKSAALIDGKGVVVFIDPATGRENKRLSVRAEAGGKVTFSPDGKTLAVGWGDGTLRLWDVANDKELSVTKSPARLGGSGLGQFAFTGEGKAVTWGVEGSKAVVWEVPSGKVLSPAGGHTQGPGTLAFTPDGKELLSNGENWTDWTVQRWDHATGKALGVVNFDVPKGVNLPGYRGVRLLGGAKALAAAGVVQYLHDPRTGKKLHDLGLSGRGNSPILCAAGELTLTAIGVKPEELADRSKPLKFSVKELATGKALCEVELPGPTLQSAARTADGKRLFTHVYVPLPNECRVFHALTLWDLATGKKLGEIELAEGPGNPTPAGADGAKVLVTHRTGEPRAYDLITGKLVREYQANGLTVCAGPVVSPDGKLFAVGLCDYENIAAGGKFEVCVYDFESDKPLKTFRGHTGLVSALAFSPDGKTLASGSHDTTILLWDLTKIGQK